MMTSEERFDFNPDKIDDAAIDLLEIEQAL
jgi:hypothetical protein